MAIIACTECEHKVSDRASSCPYCGAPLARATVGAPRWGIIGVVLTLALLGMVGSTLWRTAPRSTLGLALNLSRADVTATPLIYQTTAEQLYQDYNTNGVATQTRIGSGSVRIRGKVAAIEEDSNGHPVVKLATNHEHSADLTLTDDQTAAAAQLAKGQQVDIQCGTMHGINGLPSGSHCILALVAAASAATAASTPLPEPPAIIAAPPADAPRPTASSSTLVAGRSRARAAATHSKPAAVASALPAPSLLPAQQAAVEPPEPEPESEGIAAATPTTPQNTATAPQSTAPQNTAPQSTAPQAGTEPAPAPQTAAGADAAPVPVPVPDDLAAIRSTDPQAADHIDAYCAKAIGAQNGVSFAAGCRRDEKEAWTRLVLNKEFPTLDDDTRRKCNEPPFPDTYTAKETCARYQLGKTSTSAKR